MAIIIDIEMSSLTDGVFVDDSGLYLCIPVSSLQKNGDKYRKKLLLKVNNSESVYKHKPQFIIKPQYSNEHYFAMTDEERKNIKIVGYGYSV